MDFDIDGARKAGYSDDEIASYLGSDKSVSFDVKGALSAGYSPSEVVEELRKPANRMPQADLDSIGNSPVASHFSQGLPREQYQKTFLALNPQADQTAVDAVMQQYDQKAAARTEQGAGSVQEKFKRLQSPEQVFNDRLNERLQQHTQQMNAQRIEQGTPGIIPQLPGNQQPASFAPKEAPSTGDTVGANAVGGLLSTLMGSAAAGAALIGNKDLADELDTGRAAVHARMAELGGDSMTGRVSSIIGSVAPALLAPEGISAQLATNTGLFGIPAFRDTYKAQIAAGRSQDVALEHAVTAAGLNVALPMIAPGGARALTKAIGAADMAGMKGAGVALGQAAAEGAGFSAVATASDKAIDAANGLQTDAPWIDTKDMAANALAFGGLRVPHAAMLAGGAHDQNQAPAPTMDDIVRAPTVDAAIEAAVAAVPDITAAPGHTASQTAVSDLLKQIRPLEEQPVSQEVPRVEEQSSGLPVEPIGGAGGESVARDGMPLGERPAADGLLPGPGRADAARVGEQGAVDLPAAGEPADVQPALKVADAGHPIDESWHAFPENSGSVGVPRADMPQIDAGHHGALVNFLNARGIAHEPIEVSPGNLKPTQAEFSPEKVARAHESDTQRSVLVSADGHVLDGHHQWLASLEKGEPVKAIRLDAPINELIDQVRQFPSVRESDGVTTEPAAATEATHKDEVAQFFKPGEFEQGGGTVDTPIAAEARPLTERERMVSMRDVLSLNKALQRGGLDAVQPLKAIPSADHALAAEVAKAFGTTVHFVSSNAHFEGVAHNGVAYLSEHIKRPVLAIAGHEVFHTMEQTNPKLAAQLKEHVDQYLHEGALERKKDWLEVQGKFEPVSHETARSELMADLNGSMWLDHHFWKELAARDTNLFRQTAYKLMQVLTRGVESLQGTRFDARALVTDVDAVRGIIAKAWAEHVADRGATRAEPEESAGESTTAPAMSRDLPDTVIGGELGNLSKHPDYADAKAGSDEAAIRVVHDVVTPELIDRVAKMAEGHDAILQPVAAVESAGKNKIPLIAAAKIGAETGLNVGRDIVQASSPKRTALAGADRIFARPEFDGPVEKGRAYILLDDTITQGGTFAALAKHIEEGGGQVIGAVALTGKQYSAKMALSDSTLEKIREKYGDIEEQFRARTGHGFDALTESEGRYLANFKPADVIRDRITARGDSPVDREGTGALPEGKDQGLKYSRAEVEPSDAEQDGTDRLAKLLQAPRAALTDLKLMTVPMAEGSDVARATAKRYANQERRAQWQWSKFDEVLTKNFNEKQLEKMWTAADQENDLRRDGKTSKTKGLNSLTPEERNVVETLHAYGEQLMERARGAGMFQGEGVPYWTPRMAVMVGADGEYSRPRSPGEGESSSGDGRNISVSASSLKQRKYLTSAETEAAMKARLNEGDQTAQLVRNLRTMPMAMARLERAVAARELVNQIKAVGQAVGKETVTTAEGPGFFTLDHPAFKTWRPKFVEQDGKMVPAVDQNGDPMFERIPLYIADEFRGPLKAVMSVRPNAVYQGLMNLKAKATGLIMYSPLIHNAVEWGRALPAMDMKGKASLGLWTYISGNRAKHDPVMMREAIDAGLVPIGGRGQFMDITGIMEDPTLQPGRSWTAQVLAAPVALMSERGAVAVKKAVDAAGKFWHETLLWDRVGDLQMGLYTSMKSSLLNKGMAESDAATVAAHFANRYAGALPRESMSEGSRRLANLVLFSRTFTLGNLGALKDMVAGLPKDVQSQIRMSSGELALQAAQSAARRKAIAAFVIDIGMMYAANSLLQDWLNREKKSGWKGWLKEYGDRGGALWDKTKSDPLAVLAHPFNSLESLTSTGENEPGKEERVRWGTDDSGTEIYVRLPIGKVGEEFANYASFPAGTVKQLKAKMSTFARPLYETITNDKGFGQKVYDDGKDASMVKNVGKVVWNFMRAQLPTDQILAASDLATGHGDHMDVKKIIGPLTGLTFSKGAPGGPAVGEMYAAQREHQDKVVSIMPDVKRAMKLGDEAKAQELMQEAGMSSREIAMTIQHQENPQSRLSQAAIRNFSKHATDEQREKLQQALAR